MAVLEDQDLAFWEENGYVIIHDVVPKSNLDAMIQTIWDFLEVDGEDPDAWYHHRPRGRSGDSASPISLAGMVEVYQRQALWDNRQYPRVYEAFKEILSEDRLWVSLDRANMKPPARDDMPEWDHPGMIHWDVDTSQDPIPFGVQGVLYLTDTSEDQGGFQCVPGFHRLFDEWVKTQLEDRNPRQPDLDGLTVEAIPGKAGDLLIWHRLLAHGNGRNAADQPRLAQYITMSPARFDDDEAREERVSAWRECRPASAGPYTGDPRGWEQAQGERAELTELGRNLLGVEAW